MNLTTRKVLLILVPLLVAAGLIVGWTLSDSNSDSAGESSSAVTSSQSAPEGGSAPASDPSRTSGSASRSSTASSTPAGTADCNYDPGASLNVPAEKLVSYQDPKVGDTESPVTVVEFFDPNCSHCQAFHSVMQQVMAQYSDRVEFVMKPFPLWQYSLNQIEAMILAGREDKFYDMIDAQIARGVTSGLSDQQLIDIAEEIDLDVDAFSKALESDEVRNRAIYYHKQGERFGIRSTPTVVINGRVVAGSSRTTECMTTLIEQQLQQASTSSSNAGSTG
jgi:protein-disulfide isomerase